MYSRIFLFWACFTLAFVSGCATQPISQDSLPKLKNDEGIAAISFNSIMAVTSVQFVSVTGNEGKLQIPSVPVGANVYLFVTPAGKYCIDQYYFNHHYFHAIKHDQCFEVKKGKLSYSGTFSPTMPLIDQVVGGGGMHGGMRQDDEPGVFATSLNREFPSISASAFPTGSRESVAQLTPPAKPVSTGVCDLLSDESAAALLGLNVRAGEESKVFSLYGCNYLHNYKQSVHVLLATGDDLQGRFRELMSSGALACSAPLRSVSDLNYPAGIGNKNGDYEIDVLLPDRILALVVDGATRNDTEQAMIDSMKAMLPNVRPLPRMKR